MNMTQQMADIIGTAAGDPGCRMMTMVLEEDAPEVFENELSHCIDKGYVEWYTSPTIGPKLDATVKGEAARRAAITAGEVRA
jgi:hypothetical protein